MPAWLQVWIVFVSFAVLAILLFALRMMSRFLDRTGSDLVQVTQAVRESAARIDLAAKAAEALLTGVREPAVRVMHRLEAIGHRTADLSSTVLDEVAIPVSTAAAVMRGVRSGTGIFLKRMMDRIAHRNTLKNGGLDHER